MFPADGITKGELVDYYDDSRRRDGAAPEGPAADAVALSPRHRREGIRPAGLRRIAAGLDGSGRGRQGGRNRRASGGRPPRGAGMARQPELRHAALVAVPARPAGQPGPIVFDLDPSTADFARRAGDRPRVRRRAGRSRPGVVRADDRVARAARRGADRAATPTSTPPGSSPATSPRWSPPTILRTAPSRCARTSAVTGCIST